MSVLRLQVQHWRNLQPVDLSPSPYINIVVGDNGSGKTSLLESIYVLGVGRSFRTTKVKRLIQDGQHSCTLFIATADGHKLGLQKHLDGSSIARLNGSTASKLSSLAQLLPVQLFDPESLDMLSGPSLPRRQLLDWGVFHVEHGLSMQWARASRALQQRNSLLKSAKINADHLSVWSRELADASELIHNSRLAFMSSWQPFVDRAMKRLLPGFDFTISYHAGWDTTEALIDLLECSREKDSERGFTQLGYHRADIRIRADGVLADERLSRGQLKLCVCALKLSLIERLKANSARPILLFDDLASELDHGSREKVLSWVMEMDLQLWLTTIDSRYLTPFISHKEHAVFHVEHGKIIRWPAEQSKPGEEK